MIMERLDFLGSIVGGTKEVHTNAKIFCWFQMILVIPSLVAGT
jgi:hypothetical protein